MRRPEIKLRGKFLLIIFITTIISILSIMAIAYMHFSYLANDNITKFVKVRNYINKQFLKVETAEELEFDKLSFPENVAITVIDANNEILFDYNSISIGEEGEEIYAYQLMQKHFENKIEQNFIAELFFNTSLNLRLLLIHIENEEEMKVPRGISFLFAFVGLIVLIGAFLSSILLRSTNKSITSLEEAAKRISNGELDFEIAEGGELEIVNLKNSFEKMRKSLIKERASRSRFIMAVTHDLKTPLTSIKGYLEALQDGLAKDEETQARYFDIVQKKSMLLENRILELIDFAKMETGEWNIKVKQVSIHDASQKLIEFYENDAELCNRKFDYSIELNPRLCTLIDEHLFIRLFENLFTNALKYTEDSSHVYFNVKEDNGDVLLEICDTGKGIAEKDLNLIFEPFYRADQGRNSPGLGLGLSVVKSIIDSHDWKLEVTSSKDKGTSFIVKIPSHLITKCGK